MRCAVLCAFVASLLCGAYARTGPNGPYYPFDLKSILICQRNSIPGTVAPVPRVNLSPSDDDVVWLPVSESKDDPNLSFTLPRGMKDVRFLDDLLKNQSPLTSPTLPTEMDLTRAQFEVLANRTFPLLGVTREDFANPQSGTDFFYELIEVTNNVGISRMVPAGPFVESVALAVRNSLAQVGLGSAGCTSRMSFRWTKLPDIYYPNYFLSGACPTDNTCSLPVETGHSCSTNTLPDFLHHVRVLRYECCWNMVDRWMMRQCGWREVDIPIVTSCLCRCT